MTAFTAPVQGIAIRNCTTIEEFRACVALQKEVWNFDDADLVPLRMFVVSQKIGGQIIGAFEGKEIIGYAFSIPGARNGHPYLHSHMLAVRKQYRNLGLGRTLKLAQRQDALARGFELMEWTFDPLEIKNAHLNLVRLGAITRRYTVNHYGISSSPLHGNLPTDRLIAEWWLSSKRVCSIVDEAKPVEFSVEQTISVPGEIESWKSSPALREGAAALQKQNRELFLGAFSRGLCALGYTRGADGSGTFLLGRWDESWSYASSPETSA